MNERQMYGVFSIVEKEGREPFQNRIGYAVMKPDRSIDVVVDTFPLNGRLRLRERIERKEDAGTAARAAQGVEV